MKRNGLQTQTQLLGKSLHILSSSPKTSMLSSPWNIPIFLESHVPPLNEHKALLDVVLYLFLSQEANRDSEHWGINLIFHLCLWICTHISPRCWFFIMCCSFCIYNDSETIASVGRPLRVFSTNGEDLAQAHSNPSQQTALSCDQAGRIWPTSWDKAANTFILYHHSH